MAELVRVSDIVRDFFERKGVEHVFLLSGGMMMHLLDSISKSDKITYICNHHEQACSIAAEAYARVKNSVGLCYATSGPGATNTITGIAGAWLDSSPVIFLTGQSRTTLTTRGTNTSALRMLGNFEVDIIEIAKPITKYTAFILDPKEILFQLEKAYYLASDGRPGPVLLDIPLDVQGAMVNPDDLTHFTPPQKIEIIPDQQFEKLVNRLYKSKRPVIIAGHGIRVANQVLEFKEMIRTYNIPVVTTQLANDLLSYDNELYVGKVGLRGDRAGNFTVQNADLIISIGSSLHVTTTGYELEDFAPDAFKVVIDIDEAVLKKNKGISQAQILCDIKNSIEQLQRHARHLDINNWINKVRSWKERFPIAKEPHKSNDDQINTYYLVDELSNQLKGNEIIITDAGSLYYIVGQAFKSKENQRVIVSGALGAMGYALPAAIGAAVAEPQKQIICITGDGSMQLNVQELQTIKHYNLNCKIIVVNNKGYASIRNSQASFLDGHVAASSEATGVTLPAWNKIADAYGIRYRVENKFSGLTGLFKEMLNTEGPLLIEIVIPEKVDMLPAVTSVRLENGSFKSNRLHEMSPALPQEILEEVKLALV